MIIIIIYCFGSGTNTMYNEMPIDRVDISRILGCNIRPM